MARSSGENAGAGSAATPAVAWAPGEAEAEEAARAETYTALLASAGSTTAPLRWAAEAGKRLPFARVMQERTLLTRTHGGALSLFSSGAERDVSRIINS